MRYALALLLALVALPAQAAVLEDILATNVDLVTEAGRFVCSGVIVKQEPAQTTILSAQHCEDDVKAVQMTAYGDDGELVAVERVYTRLIASNTATDLMLIATRRPIPGQVARFDPQAALQMGDEVWAATSPLGLSRSFSRGYVASPRRLVPDFRKQWVVHVAIPGVAPGSSGGGLFTTDGRLVGITSFGAIASGNLFFVPVKDIEDMVGWRVFGR